LKFAKCDQNVKDLHRNAKELIKSVEKNKNDSVEVKNELARELRGKKAMNKEKGIRIHADLERQLDDEMKKELLEKKKKFHNLPTQKLNLNRITFIPLTPNENAEFGISKNVENIKNVTETPYENNEVKIKKVGGTTDSGITVHQEKNQTKNIEIQVSTPEKQPSETNLSTDDEKKNKIYKIFEILKMQKKASQTTLDNSRFDNENDIIERKSTIVDVSSQNENTAEKKALVVSESVPKSNQTSIYTEILTPINSSKPIIDESIDDKLDKKSFTTSSQKPTQDSYFFSSSKPSIAIALSDIPNVKQNSDNSDSSIERAINIDSPHFSMIKSVTAINTDSALLTHQNDVKMANRSFSSLDFINNESIVSNKNLDSMLSASKKSMHSNLSTSLPGSTSILLDAYRNSQFRYPSKDPWTTPSNRSINGNFKNLDNFSTNSRKSEMSSRLRFLVDRFSRQSSLVSSIQPFDSVSQTGIPKNR